MNNDVGGVRVEMKCGTYNLFNDFRGSEDIDDTLVDAHLEAIPGVGTLTARRLAGGDAENLGGHARGALNLDVLVLGTTDEISAHYCSLSLYNIHRIISKPK